MNHLYYGDNLDVLRRHVEDESVDLVYLDPPFNSNQDYNVLFKSKGTKAAAQIKAFEDTWQWDEAAALSCEETIEAGGDIAEALRALRSFLGTSDMMAYLAMMAPRLVELRRVMRPTASMYLHCDPTASHYLKIVLDAVFGPENFQNEIIWKRTSAHSSAKRYGPVHDVLLFYARGPQFVWNPQHQPYDEHYISEFYTHVDEDGRRWRRSDLTGAGTRNGETGKPWRGIDVTAKGRHWFVPPTELDKLDDAGRIHWPAKAGGVPMLKRYLDDQPGVPLQDVWTDISPLHNLAAERLHYPTQKPVALLERILLSSSNEGDVVLDPFCGCGTAISAAERLKRRWIGIDITHLAIGLIKSRLRDEFTDVISNTYDVLGEPTTNEDAAQLAHDDHYQFQWWALGLVGARPDDKKKGADKGIDGRLYFHDEKGGKTKQVIISVKSGRLKATDVRDVRAVIEREDAEIGVLISMESPTKPMRAEAASAGFYTAPFAGTKHPRLQLLTVEELLSGKGIDYPATRQMNVTHKRAPKAERDGGENKRLF